MEDNNWVGSSEGGSHPDKWCSISGALWHSISPPGLFLSLVFAVRPGGLSVPSNGNSEALKRFRSLVCTVDKCCRNPWDTLATQCGRIYACVVLKIHTHSLYSHPDLSMSNTLTKEIKNQFFSWHLLQQYCIHNSGSLNKKKAFP